MKALLVYSEEKSARRARSRTNHPADLLMSTRSRQTLMRAGTTSRPRRPRLSVPCKVLDLISKSMRGLLHELFIIFGRRRRTETMMLPVRANIREKVSSTLTIPLHTCSYYALAFYCRALPAMYDDSVVGCKRFWSDGTAKCKRCKRTSSNY